MDKFINLALSGGVSGAIYSLLAIGLVLSYTTSRIFNFGHAATAFSTAYLFYQLNSGVGWPVWLSLIATVGVFAPMAGLAWDRLVFRRLADADEAAKIVASIGVLIVMPGVVLLVSDILRRSTNVGFIDTSQAFKVPGIGPNPPTVWHVTDGLVINSDQVIVLGVGVIAFLALWALLRFTRLGLQLRSSVDSPTLARLRGTNTSHMSTVAWLLSFFIAGLAGVLAAPIPGAFGLSPDAYTFALFVAATAAVVAGLRSIPVAFAAGLALGAARNLAEGYLSEEYLGGVGRWIEGVYGLRSSLPYWVLFGALIVLGHDRRRRVAGTSAVSAPPVDYLADLPPWRRVLPWAVAGAGVLAFGLGPADNIWRQIVITGLATGIVFLSFTVVTGLGGMVSLAQATFVTLSGLVMGLCLSNGWPFLAAMAAGVLAAALLGAVAALPALRLEGLFLALSTLALALLSSNVLFNNETLTNSAQGWRFSRPELGPIDLNNDRVFLVVVFVVLVVVVWLVRNLTASPSGRAMIALRSAPPAAAASAVPPATTKLTVFVISAIIAGVGGTLLVSVPGTVRGTDFPPILGFTWLAAVVIFGLQRPGGAVVAGLVTSAMPRLLNRGIHLGDLGWDGTASTLIPPILFGLGAIGLAKHPEGILSQTAQKRYEKRRARAAKAVAPLPPEPTTPPSIRIASIPPTGATSGMVSTLELRGLRAGYGEVEVLHGIDLVVARGTILAILGANGAGKSTLAGAIAGLVPATAGRLILDGEDITSLSAHARVRKGLALIPESRGIFPSLTVDDNLSLWLPSAADRDVVYDRFPNLANRRQVSAGNLSGGEQQMLSVGPFLARPPKLLVADEPTLGLSVLVSAHVVAAFAELQARGTTLILIEEKARDVMTVADQVGAIARGELQWVQPRADVDERHVAEAYLGMAAVSSSD